MNPEAHSDQFLETIATTGSRHVDRETATELLTARKELPKLRKELETLGWANQGMCNSLKKMRDGNAELQRKLDLTEKQRDEHLAEVERLRGELANEIIARRDQQERAGKAEAERDDLQRKLDAEVAQHMQTHAANMRVGEGFANWRDRAFKAEQERDDLKRQLQDVSTSHDSTYINLQAMRSRAVRAETERDEARDELRRQAVQINALQQQVNTLRQQRDGAHAREECLSKDLQSLRAMNSATAERCRTLADDLGAKQQECSDLRRQLASLDRADATVRHLKLVAQGGEIYVHSTRDDGGTEVQRL